MAKFYMCINKELSLPLGEILTVSDEFRIKSLLPLATHRHVFRTWKLALLIANLQRKQRQEAILLWWPLGLSVACCASQRKTTQHWVSCFILLHLTNAYCVASPRIGPMGMRRPNGSVFARGTYSHPEGKHTQGSRIPERPSEIVTCVAPVPGIDGLDEVKSILVDVIRKTREEDGKVIHQNGKLTQSARTGCLCFQLYPPYLAHSTHSM